MQFSSGFWKKGAWLLALVFAFATCQAQDFRATLTGQVSDPSGALIPGTKVTATNVDTGTNYSAITSAKGVYYINYVLPGVYTVVATAPGFKTDKQEKVTLLTSQTFNQNFTLTVGGSGDTVTVTTEPPALETSTASGNTIIGSREIENVPVNGGQIYGLIGTTPGSQATNTQGTPLNGYTQTNNYTLGGGIVGNNQFTLNGSNVTSQFTYDNQAAGAWSVAPNLDSVQEVNVMTTTYDARFGRTSGGTVNTESKSGTNQYHATGRYAYQGTNMNANTYQNNLVGSPRNSDIQNQFWVTAGGPIIKNKLFVFFGFEGFHQVAQSSLFENVPPAYLRPGYSANGGINFGLVQTMDPAHFPNGLPIYQPGSGTCSQAGVTLNSCAGNDVVQQEFAADTIPSNMISPIATAILKFLPLPNLSSAANEANGSNYFAQNPSLLHYNQPQIRVDYNLSDKTKLYSYFIYTNGSAFQNANGLSGLATHGTINQVHTTWVATQDVTHTFSNTLTGDFKVSFMRFFANSPDGNLSTQTSPTTLGLTMPLPGSTSSNYLPEFTIGDGWGTGFDAGNTQIFGNNDNISITNNFALNVDFTKTHGSHTLEFGGEIDEFQFGGYPDGGGNPNGSFDFNAGFTQFDPANQNCYNPTGGPNPNCGTTFANNQNGSSLANFYLGYPASGHVDWIGSIMEGYPVYAAYFQDNWRVTRKMTLNIGLRYDVQRGLRERHNNLNRGICLTCVNPVGATSQYQANVANSANQAAWSAAGISVSTQVMGGIEFPGVNGQGRDAYNTDWSDVGPRFGFAYQIDNKTVIRGGWGLMYSYGLEGGSSIGETQPTQLTTSLNGGYSPTTNFQSGKPFSSGLLAPTGNSLGLETDLGNGGVQVDFPQRKIPMEQIMSLGFQRELPGKVVIDARYAGNFTYRLRTFLWTNGTASLAQEQEAIANNAYFDAQVPNPFYNVPGMSGPGQCGTGATIPAVDLRTILPQYCSPGGNGLVGEYNAPIGGNFYNGLEVKLNKRLTGQGRGLSFQIAYTYSKTLNEDGYENGWPYQDIQRIHQLAGTDRTHVLAVTSVYNLPIGRGGLVFTHAPKLVDNIIGGWTLGGVFYAQSGTPVGVNTGWYYTCTQSYKPAGGSTLGHWFSTANNPSSCWQGIPRYGLMNLTGTTGQVRNPTIPDLDVSLEKTIRLPAHLDFQFRLDAFNATNSVLFGGPDTNPGDGAAAFTSGVGWHGFGTVGYSQQNTPRTLQVQGKISF